MQTLGQGRTTNHHHRYFTKKLYEYLPYQVAEIFRGLEQVLLVPVVEHERFNLYLQKRGCIESRRGIKQCRDCGYAGHDFCGPYDIRAAAFHSRMVSLRNPGLSRFPCVKALIRIFDSREYHCKASKNCRKRGRCQCGACLNWGCKKLACDPNLFSAVKNCPEFSSVFIVSKEVPMK